MSFQLIEQEENLKEFAFSELKKALEIYKTQKEHLKTEFSIDLNWDKDIIRKLESRLSLLNTKISTIALVLTQEGA
jgi:hypothetical protein